MKHSITYPNQINQPIFFLLNISYYYSLHKMLFNRSTKLLQSTNKLYSKLFAKSNHQLQTQIFSNNNNNNVKFSTWRSNQTILNELKNQNSILLLSSNHQKIHQKQQKISNKNFIFSNNSIIQTRKVTTNQSNPSNHQNPNKLELKFSEMEFERLRQIADQNDDAEAQFYIASAFERGNRIF